MFTIAATVKHSATVIFLHGLGETGHKWSMALERIRSPYIKYVCPTANIIPLTVNAGTPKTAWYDVYGMTHKVFEEDNAGLKQAAKLVQEMVKQEIRQSIDSTRIVLGGFSQGGALALYSALTSKQQLAGILVLSSRLPFANTFPRVLSHVKFISMV
jgi:predicted esterase